MDQIITSGGNFIVGVYCARYLSIEDVGLYGYVLSTYLVMVVLSLALIFQPLAIYYPSLVGRMRLSYIRSLFCFYSFYSVFLSIFALSFVFLMLLSVGYEGKGGEFFCVLLGYFFFQHITDFGRRSEYVFSNPKGALTLSALLSISRVLLLFSVEPQTFDGVLFVLAFTAMISFSIVVYKNYSGDCDFGLTRIIDIHYAKNKWLVYSSPLIWLWSYGPVFVLGVLGGIDKAGLFFLARSLLNVANVAMEILETHVSSELGRLHVSKGHLIGDVVYKIGKLSLFVWGVAFAAIGFAGVEVFEYVYAVSGADLLMLLIILWVAYGLIFLFRLRAVYLRTLGEQRSVFLGYAIGGGVSCVATYFLADLYGEIGAAIALCLGAAAILLGQSMLRVTKRD